MNFQVAVSIDDSALGGNVTKLVDEHLRLKHILEVPLEGVIAPMACSSGLQKLAVSVFRLTVNKMTVLQCINSFPMNGVMMVALNCDFVPMERMALLNVLLVPQSTSVNKQGPAVATVPRHVHEGFMASMTMSLNLMITLVSNSLKRSCGGETR